MNVLVQGSKTFSDYQVFMRAMGVALGSIEDDEFVVYSIGPTKVNSFATEFVNLSERNLKARGIKPKLQKVPHSWGVDKLPQMDYVAYLCNANEKHTPTIIDLAEMAGLPNAIFRY
jgi:hypothetical protein